VNPGQSVPTWFLLICSGKELGLVKNWILRGQTSFLLSKSSNHNHSPGIKGEILMERPLLPLCGSPRRLLAEANTETITQQQCKVSGLMPKILPKTL